MALFGAFDDTPTTDDPGIIFSSRLEKTEPADPSKPAEIRSVILDDEPAADDQTVTDRGSPPLADHTAGPIRNLAREDVDPSLAKDRRRRYLVLNPDYFGPELELADPLLYDRLVRRFQSAAEREAEGRKKGFSGVLEADLRRSEAKLDAIANPNPRSAVTYCRGSDGEVVAEDTDEVPESKEAALASWKFEMEMRFVRGEDGDFDYDIVDRSDEYDDRAEIERRFQDDYFDSEQPEWNTSDGLVPAGETGVQDF